MRTRLHAMSQSRMRLLATLEKHGPQIMSRLKDEMCVTAKSITALVDHLEGDGLVQRVPHPTDRRATVVEITSLGSAAFAASWDEFVHETADVFSVLPPEDREHLARILGALRVEVTRRSNGHLDEIDEL
jgi:DNA-binding MarR family transcriptional regulator